MNLALVVPLGVGAVALAGVALVTRRIFASAVAMAAMGVLVGALLLVSGFPGLGVAALGSTWGVAAAGLVVSRTLSEVEEREPEPRRRGPWTLALGSSLLLVSALALGVLAVDWSGTSPGAGGAGGAHGAGGAPGGGSGAGSVAAGWTPGLADLADWTLALLGISAALALAAFTPGREEE